LIDLGVPARPRSALLRQCDNAVGGEDTDTLARQNRIATEQTNQPAG